MHITLPRFAQSLIYLLLHFAQSQIYAPSLHSVTFHSMVPSKLPQNLHSRGPTKQHFYVWEPRCGCLHKVKRANGANEFAFKRFYRIVAKILIHHIEKWSRTPIFYATRQCDVKKNKGEF